MHVVIALRRNRRRVTQADRYMVLGHSLRNNPYGLAAVGPYRLLSAAKLADEMLCPADHKNKKRF
jgi:hypothetical protein